MSTAVRAVTQRMEKERSTIERFYIRRAAPLLRAMRVQALQNYRTGIPPAQAVSQWIPQIRNVTRDAVLAAHIRGRARSRLQFKQITMSRNPLDAAIEYASDIMKMPIGKVVEVAGGHSPLFEVDRSVERLEANLTKTLVDIVSKQLHVKAGTNLLRKAFEKSGFGVVKPFALETLLRTKTLEAYNAGRWVANNEPHIQEILWGYEYDATMDDRTTEMCSELHGTRQPKESLFWLRFWPPNHWNCRSVAIEVFVDEEIAEPTEIPNILPMTGFQFNAGERMLRAA